MKALIHQYGVWIAFALVFLESIGLPLPGEAILVSAAILAGTTQALGITSIVVSAVLGATLGSATCCRASLALGKTSTFAGRAASAAGQRKLLLNMRIVDRHCQT
jgi:membrane protein YqaA with SNARE-associated domain